MSELLFPSQFRRQYSGALDIDMVFNTDFELQEYLTNPRRYSGQTVTCLEHEGRIFILNNTLDAWLESSVELDTDPLMLANSDTVAPSQKAVVSYTQGLIQGVKWKTPCRVSTQNELNAIYDNSGGTLTNNELITEAIVIDGISLTYGDRVLVRHQTSGNTIANGIYEVIVTGDSSTAWILRRTTDADTGDELELSTVLILEGTNINQKYTCQQYEIILGTTHITYVQSSSAADDTYTNPLPSVITVGGIPAGTTFNARTMTNMFDDLFYPELFPTLTNPNNAFALTQAGLREIGQTGLTLNFTSTFNRGTINPAYTTSGFRSGLPTRYNYTGSGLPINISSSSLTNNQTVTGYTVLSGVQTWGNIVTYSQGEQPLSSKLNPYNTPLPSGNTTNKAVTITGVYPVFATTVNITTMTKQALALMNSTYVQTNMVLEDGVNKQIIDIPVAWLPITGIQFYNTINSTWEWIGGSRANSLLTFTISSVTNTIQGNVINYNRYTHNGSTIGARMLRWYTT